MNKPELLYHALTIERLIELNDLEGLKRINDEMLLELRGTRKPVKEKSTENDS